MLRRAAACAKRIAGLRLRSAFLETILRNAPPSPGSTELTEVRPSPRGRGRWNNGAQNEQETVHENCLLSGPSQPWHALARILDKTISSGWRKPPGSR